jgi:hypothetical protein
MSKRSRNKRRNAQERRIDRALEAANHLDKIMPVTCALLRMMAVDIERPQTEQTKTR